MTIEPRTDGYVDVNGVHMYYEVYGDGSPLVLLHGGVMTIELDFAALLPELVTRHTVIAVELQGHGRTADTGRAITPAALASDVVGLLDHLGIDRAHVLGDSLGGGGALDHDDVDHRAARRDARGDHRPQQARHLVPDADAAGLRGHDRGIQTTLAAPGALRRLRGHAVQRRVTARGLDGRAARRRDRADPADDRRPRLHHGRARSADAPAHPRLAAGRPARHDAHEHHPPPRPRHPDARCVPGLTRCSSSSATPARVRLEPAGSSRPGPGWAPRIRPGGRAGGES